LVNGQAPVVALFGGSFDPPHQGHQQIVSAALETLDIDTLIVLPAYLNPFKTASLADASQRLKWCRELFGDIPGVIVSDYEIRQEKSVKTAQSVRHFQKDYRVKYLIIGADNLSTLTQWYDFEWLNEQIVWVVATRDGYPLETDVLRSWRTLPVKNAVSSSLIRDSKNTEAVDTRIVRSVKKILEG